MVTKGAATKKRCYQAGKSYSLWLFSFLICFFLAKNVSGQSVENYNDTYRPQFHFSPARNWMNDPNGLVFSGRKYHLFFQYDPSGSEPLHAVWGHAVSEDLVHWKELPVAIPEENGIMAASGSAVIDWKNSSGFEENGRPPLVAFYGGVRAGDLRIYLAYSSDAGRTWKQYKGNPILGDAQNFRDPKVFWYAPGNIWVMAISGGSKVRFYESLDLREWKFMSEFGPPGVSGGSWECPDLFPLAVDDNPGDVKWVLVVSVTSRGGVVGDLGVQYFIGQFNGRKFIVDKSSSKHPHWADYGKDFYAAQSFSDISRSDGRRIWIGWMNNWLYAQKVPTKPWRGAQTIPRQLSLRTFSDGVRLVQQPVPELKKLRGKLHEFRNVNLGRTDSLFESKEMNGNTLEIEAEIRMKRASKFGFEVRKSETQRTIIGYDAVRHDLFIDRSKSGITDFSKKFSGLQTVQVSDSSRILRLHIFVDWSSVELFAEDGKVVITNLVFPSRKSSGFDFLVSKGTVELMDLKVWHLKSIWRN